MVSGKFVPISAQHAHPNVNSEVLFFPWSSWKLVGGMKPPQLCIHRYRPTYLTRVHMCLPKDVLS
jgi:hypothetical protein